MEHLLLLLAALTIDAVIGEPAPLWRRVRHPRVVAMLAAGACRTLPLSRYSPKTAGAVAAILLTVGALALGVLISAMPDYGVLELAAVVALLGFRDIIDRLSVAERAMAADSETRAAALARIARRPLEVENEGEAARVAVEMTATHFVDRVVSPAFWYLLFGLPGMLLAFTADAARSVFVREPADEDGFGRGIVSLDDSLKWAPGRIAGWAMVLASYPREVWEIMVEDSALHRSSYAGWPVAATAGALDVSLSDGADGHGPHIHRNGRKGAGPDDLAAQRALLWGSWGVIVALLTLIVAPAVVF